MNRGILLLAAISLAAPARAETFFSETSDHLISIVKDLNADECEFARARAMGEPATTEEKAEARQADDEAAAAKLERMTGRRKFADAHHCIEGDGDVYSGACSWPATTTASSVDQKTKECVWGTDLGEPACGSGGGSGGGQIIYGNRIWRAECFK